MTQPKMYFHVKLWPLQLLTVNHWFNTPADIMKPWIMSATHQNWVSERPWLLVAAVDAVHGAGLASPLLRPGLHGAVAHVVHGRVFWLIRLAVTRVETHLVSSRAGPAVTIYIFVSRLLNISPRGGLWQLPVKYLITTSGKILPIPID